MSLPKIPRKALQLLRIIRAEVPKPRELPLRPGGGWALRWGSCCPMGLHDDSSFDAPGSGHDFAGGRCATDSVLAFWSGWWERILPYQAQEAVDFIWPEVAP